MISNMQDMPTLTKEYIKIFYKDENFLKFFKNNIVVDMGSGYGDVIPFILLFSPKGVISVEPSSKTLDIQKEFLSKEIKFLKKKQIKNIKFYNETAEEFCKNNINFDTIMFFDSLCVIHEFFTEEEQPSTAEYTEKLLNYCNGKNIIIMHSINYVKIKGIRSPSHDDYIDFLKKMNYKNIVINFFKFGNQDRFIIFAMPT